MNTAKIERELGWQAQRTFEQALPETVAWYHSNPAWWQPLLNRYAGQRLGMSGSTVAASS
jgi:dTDP-glucose 4,6-dehydratase